MTYHLVELDGTKLEVPKARKSVKIFKRTKKPDFKTFEVNKDDDEQDSRSEGNGPTILGTYRRMCEFGEG